MAPPKRNADKGKGPTTKLPIQKPIRPQLVNYGPFLDASGLSNYKNYFSKRPIAIEHHVHKKTLFNTLIGYMLVSGGWESLMMIQGIVQEEAV